MQKTTQTLAVMFSLALSGCAMGAGLLVSNTRFEIVLAAGLAAEPLDGRLFLMLSTQPEGEPRSQVANWGSDTQPLFAVTVEGFSAAAPVVIDRLAAGYPVDGLADLPAGEYRVQALLHRYTTFERGDGHTIKAPMDQWEGVDVDRV